MHLHTFLGGLHQKLKPEVYLEVGVQFGTSLQLAGESRIAYGIDPNPLADRFSVNVDLIKMTSDMAFGPTEALTYEPINLAFIDGLHHGEQVVKDFINVAKRLAPGGIIVLDDVLPRNDVEASRTQCPGDWTGDVWRAGWEIYQCDEVSSHYINTTPTGTLVVTGVTPRSIERLTKRIAFITKLWSKNEQPVPDWVLSRELAIQPDVFLDQLRMPA